MGTTTTTTTPDTDTDTAPRISIRAARGVGDTPAPSRARAGAVRRGMIPDRWDLLNPNASRMVDVTGTVLAHAALRIGRNAYTVHFLDTGRDIVAARVGAHRALPVGSRVSCGLELVDGVAPSCDGVDANMVLASRGVRSWRLADDDTPNGIAARS